MSADGTLRLPGVTKKEVCVGDIETKLKRSDFEMNTYLPAIWDDILVKVPVEAVKD